LVPRRRLAGRVHGLRKAGCTRLAEAGCSANEIASISGHRSLQEVERYTKAAEQERMARNAMARTVDLDRG
jgi:integrase